MKRPAFSTRFPGLLTFLMVLVAFQGIIGWIVVTDHRREVSRTFHQHIEEELDLMTQVIQEAVLRHDLPTIESFLTQWGKRREEVIGIKATTANGFVLVDYRRYGPARRHMTHHATVGYLGETFLELEIRHDLEFIDRATGHMGWKLGTISVALTTLLALTLWWVLRRTSVKPLAREIARREEVEAELRRSQRDYRTIFETVHAMVWHLDREHRVKRVNRLAANHSGMEPGHVVGKTVFDLFPRELAEPYHADNLQVMNSGKAKLGIVEPGPYGDGGKGWFRTDKVPFFDDAGNVAGLTILVTDITPIKRAEEAIRESEAKFREMADSAPMFIWLCGTDKQCTFVNQSWLDFTGRTLKEELGFGWSDRIHPDDHERSLEIYTSAFDAREPFSMEYRHRRHDGEYHWILDQGVPRIAASGGFQGYIGSCTDITDRKRSEKALEATHRRLQASEERLRAILDNTEAVVFLKDTEGRYLLVNRRYEVLFHVTDEEIRGRTDFDLFPAEMAQAFQENDRRAAEHGGSLSIEERVPQDDGIHTYISVKFPLRDENGTIYGVCGIATDITERKRMEEALRMAKESADAANRAKSAFLATMSHEIRTPLNAILGMGEVLADSRLTKAQAQCITTIDRSGKTLLTLIDDILDLAKIEADQLTLERTAFDLRRLVEESMSLFSLTARSKGIELRHRVDENVSTLVWGDPARLRQVLLNLVGNAVKFTEKGHVSMTVQGASGDQLSFSVTDTGTGIREERQEEIFRPFTQADASTTRKYGGSGLGLTICRRLAEMMGGTHRA